jgi:Ni/Co efflux regulator RcnB
MKRIALAGLSALTLAGSLAGTAQAQNYNQYDHRGDRDGRDNRDNRGDWNRDNDRRGDNDRDQWRRGDRRDQFARNWRRGDRLPFGWDRRYRAVDYRYAHLRQPPYGYRYVRDDRGEVLLVGIATGVILSAIFSNY